MKENSEFVFNDDYVSPYDFKEGIAYDVQVEDILEGFHENDGSEVGKIFRDTLTSIL